MKNKNSPPDFDLRDWASRLEAGRTDDPELVLAKQLSVKQDMPAQQPSDGFRLELRARLLQSYARPDRKVIYRRVFPFVTAILLLLIALLAWPRGIQGVSAADLVREAKIGPTGNLPSDNLVYDRLRLDWNLNGSRMENVTGEMWYSPKSQVYRYQLTSSTGEVLFYQAYDGEYTTQSVHNQPVGEQPVEQVYRFQGFVPLWLDRPGEGGLLANPSPVNFWVLAVRQSLEHQADCNDLFCLLGLSQEGWDCSETRCTYTFGEVGDLGNMGLELVLKGQTRMDDGREAYEIRLLPGGSLAQYATGFGTIYVDVQTYQIVKVAYSLKVIFRPAGWEMSVEHLERRWLNTADLPDDFYRTPPKGVSVVPWEGNLKKFLNSQFGDHENRVWVISADPPSGTRISGEVTFNLELGYQLTGLPYANLKSSLWGVGKDIGSPGGSMPVQAGEGIVHMSFRVDTDQLAEGAWALGTDLGTYIDAGSGFAINDLTLFDTQWCVRCDPSTLPAQPPLLGTYWRPLILVVTTGQIAEGYQVKHISVSPTHVLLHRAGLISATDLPQIVETEPIDLHGLSHTQVITVKLKLPEMGELIGQPKATVTIEIELSSP